MQKSKLVTLLLCTFLGGFGVHRFYLGKIGTGILYLFTFGLFGIGVFVDLINIARNGMKDKNGRELKEDVPYFFAWIIIAAIIVIFIFGAVNGTDNNGDTTSDTNITSGETATDTNAASGKTENKTQDNTKEVNIEYLDVTVDELAAELRDNALRAEQNYNNKYVAVRGKLSNIDSSGKYISIEELYNEFSFDRIQCYIKNPEQKEIVVNLNNGDYITVYGKITRVGEVLGYSLDIDDIQIN